MTQLSASRTLVKSPPELWAQCSDPASLTRHLDTLGEIRITRLDPESTVAWEGDAACGTVHLEPAGWGTKVTLTATPAETETESETETEAQALDETSEPVLESANEETREPVLAAAPPRLGLLARLRRLLRGPAAPDPDPYPDPGVAPDQTDGAATAPGPVADAPVSPAPPAPVPEPTPVQQALTAALDSLGRAHHRPFSRG